MGVVPQAPSAGWLTEDQIKDSLVKGIPIVLPPIAPGEPTGDEVRRTVRSEWLAALATQPDREIRVPIVLSGVIVRGPLSLKYVNCFTDFSITDSLLRAHDTYRFLDIRTNGQTHIECR